MIQIDEVRDMKVVLGPKVEKAIKAHFKLIEVYAKKAQQSAKSSEIVTLRQKILAESNKIDILLFNARKKLGE